MVTTRSPERYRERSGHFLARVDSELAAGEIEVACELLWGAAAQAIKSVAQQSGWPHDEHRLLRIAVSRLINAGAPSHLLGQYRMASDFHRGFYGDREFNAGNIRLGKEVIADFIQTLQSSARQ